MKNFRFAVLFSLYFSRETASFDGKKFLTLYVSL